MGNICSSSNQKTQKESERNLYRAEALRRKAEEAGNKRKQLSEASQQAYKQNEKAKAKQLSEDAKLALEHMNAYNEEASRIIFTENNKNLTYPDSSIDLHGLYVKEAVHFTREKIRKWQKSSPSTADSLVIIVGAGNHSIDNVQKIKPAIEDLLKNELGFSSNSILLDTPNKGCITIESKTSKGNNSSSWVCVLM